MLAQSVTNQTNNKGKTTMQQLTNMRNYRGEKIGSQAIRDGIARDIRLIRRLDATAEKIGNLVAKRIATPKRSNDVQHLATGASVLSVNDGKRIAKLPALAKVTPNATAGMMKTSPRANGNFPSRFVNRKDIELSYSDREEIKSVVRAVLALSIEPDGIFWSNGARYELPHWRDGEKVPDGIWRVIFRAVRDTLGMHKIMSREVSYNTPEMEQTLSVVVDLASDALEDTASEQARRARIIGTGEHFRKCMRAAFEADKSRKRKARFNGLMAFCDVAEALALGATGGHGMKSLEGACDWRKRFLAYVAEGESLLKLEPATIKAELEIAFAERAIE